MMPESIKMNENDKKTFKESVKEELDRLREMNPSYIEGEKISDTYNLLIEDAQKSIRNTLNEISQAKKLFENFDEEYAQRVTKLALTTRLMNDAKKQVIKSNSVENSLCSAVKNWLKAKREFLIIKKIQDQVFKAFENTDISFQDLSTDVNIFDNVFDNTFPNKKLYNEEMNRRKVVGNHKKVSNCFTRRIK